MSTEKIYSVYCHTCPNGMQYFGVSKDLKRRWLPSLYKESTLFYESIIKFGWDVIKHDVLYSGLSEDEALKIEDELIVKARESGVCLNVRRSGHFKQTDEYKEERKASSKAWREAHPEENKAYWDANKDKINARRRERYKSKKAEKEQSTKQPTKQSQKPLF